MRKQFSWALIAVAGVMLSLASLSAVKKVHAAVTAVYGNSADGTPYVLVMTPGTLAVNRTISNLSGSNGRGVVVVGSTMYYTSASTPNVFSYNLTTGVDNGSVFTVAGTSALSTLAFDGTNFWIGDYGGSGKAYQYSLTGTLLKTITLANCSANCDGLEFFLSGTNGRLISNRGDAVGPYDVYDTNGTLITAAFITQPSGVSPTGIAFDGTNFLVSDIFGGKIDTFNGTTGAFISATAITGATSPHTPVIEDLSVDYTQVLNPGPTTVPLLSTPLMLVLALLMLGLGLTLMQKRASA